MAHNHRNLEFDWLNFCYGHSWTNFCQLILEQKLTTCLVLIIKQYITNNRDEFSIQYEWVTKLMISPVGTLLISMVSRRAVGREWRFSSTVRKRSAYLRVTNRFSRKRKVTYVLRYRGKIDRFRSDGELTERRRPYWKRICQWRYVAASGKTTGGSVRKNLILPNKGN